MKLNAIPVAAIALCAACAGRLPAQMPEAAPNVLMLMREQIKPGREAAHEKSEEAWSRIFRKGNLAAHYLGMTSESGPPEAWFLLPFDSFAAMEKVNAEITRSPVASEFEAAGAADAEMRTGSRVWLAIFRGDLSYRPGDAMTSLPKCRHVAVTLLRIKYGHDAELAQAAKLLIDADERAMSDQPVLTYQVISGGPSGLYLIFSPMPSLARLDEAPARTAEARRDMGEHNRERLGTLAAETVQSSENLLFAFNPRMSYVSGKFAAGDPAFWKVAPEAPSKPAVRRKRAAKPAHPTP